MREKKVAIVTGGADGLGKVIAESLIKNQYNVAAFDIKKDSLKNTAEELQAIGTYLPFVTNVVDEEQVNDSVMQVVEKYGRVDVLVNNAGGSLAISQEIEKILLEDWVKVIDLNLKSTFLCTKAVLPVMKKGKWGRIINMSSLAGRSRSVFGGTPYAAAKAGIIGFTRQGSKEVGIHNITINAIAPGTIISGERIRTYWNNKSQEERDIFIKTNPAGRPGNPHEVAGVVSFLCTEEASYINGAVIDVNGGYWVG